MLPPNHKPPRNYNSSRCGRNLTRLIMSSEPDYDSAQKMITIFSIVSPEPRIFDYSQQKANERYIFKQSSNLIGGQSSK